MTGVPRIGTTYVHRPCPNCSTSLCLTTGTPPRSTGSYEMSTAVAPSPTEGFIHCSFAEQVRSTISRFYGDVGEVVLLRIDPDRLTSPIVVEDLVGSGESFPHVYGPIDLDAVVEATTSGVSDV